MATLMRRNTRRYGGYLVHFGIVVMFIGIAGGAFNQSHEQEMAFGDTVKIGPYKLICQSYTQDSKPEYDTDYALLDVYKGAIATSRSLRLNCACTSRTRIIRRTRRWSRCTRPRRLICM